MIFRSVLGLVLASVLCGFIQDDWVLFSPDERFSIEFPGKPVLFDDDTTLQLGMKSRAWQFANDDDERAYTAGYMEIPGAMLAGNPGIQEKIYEAISEEMLENPLLDFQVDSKKTLDLGGVPGIEMRVSGIREQDSVRIFQVARVFVTSNRIYSIISLNRGDRPDSLAGDRFFNSFKILQP